MEYWSLFVMDFTLSAYFKVKKECNYSKPYCIQPNKTCWIVFLNFTIKGVGRQQLNSTQLNTTRPFYWVSHSWDWMHSTLRPRVNDVPWRTINSYGRFRFLGVGGNWSSRRKPTKADMESANQIHIQPLVKQKCSSTKPTRLAAGVVCHPDTEQNRPYKITWFNWELNLGPTAGQARTLHIHS